MRRPLVDSRGQSIALDYALSLSIGFLLITGLVVGGGDFFSDQSDRAQEAELRVIGQQVAAQISAADRLVQAGEGDTTVRIERRLPEDVARSEYSIELIADQDPSLLLETTGSSVEVRVELVNETSVASSTVSGGNVVVTTTGSGDLQIERGESYV